MRGWLVVFALLVGGCSLDFDALVTEGGDAGADAAARRDAGAIDAEVPSPDAGLDAGRSDDAGPLPPADPVVQIAAGGGTTCARTTSQALFCWGDNRRGQLQVDPGTLTFADAPRRLTVDGDATDVTVGSLHVCAIAAGVISCWGDGTEGQIGLQSSDPQPAPVPLMTETALQVAAGAMHTCAVVYRISGTRLVQCWGLNDRQQLARSEAGSPDPRTVPNLNDPLEVHAGRWHTCAIDMRASAEVTCWGDNRADQLGRPAVTGQTPNPSRLSAPAAGPALIPSVLALGPTHGCAVDGAGRLFCWGDNTARQSSAGSMTTLPRYDEISLNSGRWDLVAAGGEVRDPNDDPPAAQGFTCAATAEGLWCWGADDYGQLGLGDSRACDGTSPDVAQSPREVPIAGLPVEGIAAGARHLCVIAGGRVYCAGSNERGQLGRPMTDTPCSTALLPVVGLP